MQELNALPFAAMAVNCAAWVYYSLLLTDYYIYFGNLPGMLCGLFYVLTCYKFSKEAVSAWQPNTDMYSGYCDITEQVKGTSTRG
jgi:hypothetical protein